MSAIPSARLRSVFTGGTAATAVGATVSLTSRMSSSHMAAACRCTPRGEPQQRGRRTDGILVFGLFNCESHADPYKMVHKREALRLGCSAVQQQEPCPGR